MATTRSVFSASGASALTGLIGALTIVLAERHFGSTSFAPVANLWTIWAVLGASILLGAQSLALSTRGDRVDLLRSLFLTQAAPAALLVSALVFTLRHAWFEDEGILALCAAAIPFGVVAMGASRGLAAQAHRDDLLAVVLVGENLIRLIAVATIIVFELPVFFMGLALLAGFAPGFWLLSTQTSLEPRPAINTTSASPIAQLSVSLIGLCSYALMFGSPLLLSIKGAEPRQVTAVFLVLMIARIPYVLAIGVAPVLLARSRLVDNFKRAQDSVRGGVATLGAASTIGLVAASTAEGLLQRALPGIAGVGRSTVGLTAMASVIAIVNLLLSLFLSRTVDERRLVGLWICALGAFVIFALASDRDSSLSIWLVVVETAILVVLLMQVPTAGSGRSSSTPHHHD